jgi:hypothetical protein
LRLCSAEVCHYSRNEQPLYEDSNHLNGAGIAELGDIFSVIFDATPTQ